MKRVLLHSRTFCFFCIITRNRDNDFCRTTCLRARIVYIFCFWFKGRKENEKNTQNFRSVKCDSISTHERSNTDWMCDGCQRLCSDSQIINQRLGICCVCMHSYLRFFSVYISVSISFTLWHIWVCVCMYVCINEWMYSYKVLCCVVLHVLSTDWK